MYSTFRKAEFHQALWNPPICRCCAQEASNRINIVNMNLWHDDLTAWLKNVFLDLGHEIMCKNCHLYKHSSWFEMWEASMTTPLIPIQAWDGASQRIWQASAMLKILEKCESFLLALSRASPTLLISKMYSEIYSLTTVKLQYSNGMILFNLEKSFK